jgi:hypothetical protein
MNLYDGSFAREPADARDCKRLPLPPLVPCFSGLEFRNINGLGLISFRRSRERYQKHFMDRFAVIEPFTAGNAEISRCYFAVPVAKNRGILRLSAISSLFFCWETAKNSGGAAPRARGSRVRPKGPSRDDASRQLIRL